MNGAGPELHGSQPQGEIGHQESAHQADKIGHGSEQRQHQHGGDNARCHQFSNWVGTQCAHSINLLGYNHGAEFGGDTRCVAPGNKKRRDCRPQLADQRERHRVAGERGFSEALELRGGLQHQYAADKKSGEHDDRQRTDADDVHLLERVGPVMRRCENVRQGLKRQFRVILHHLDLALNAFREGRDYRLEGFVFFGHFWNFGASRPPKSWEA